MSQIKNKHSCVVQNCKQNMGNKSPGVTFHPLPTQSEMRSRWLSILKTRCSSLDWNKSRICSKHFDSKCFDSQKKLKDSAVPYMFSAGGFSAQKFVKTMKTVQTPNNKTKVDRLINKCSQIELHSDIKNTMNALKTPENLSDFVDDDLQINHGSPIEAQLWLLIKKQEHLITRLLQQSMQTRKHIEVLQNNMEESRTEKKEMEQAVENYKYIAKCLQEKHATLEEQIEILTAVESR